jgi:replication-associated recombination protein RarA
VDFGALVSLFADSQSSLNFPASLSEKYRPRRIADFIGLEKQRKVLAAFAKRPASCAWLFLGPSGIGKSTMALALAGELQAEVHKIPSQKCNAQAIEDTVRTCWYAPMLPGGFHLVLADEADQMTNAAQLALLSKLDATDPAPNTIWILHRERHKPTRKAFPVALPRAGIFQLRHAFRAGGIVAARVAARDGHRRNLGLRAFGEGRQQQHSRRAESVGSRITRSVEEVSS